MDKLQHIDDLLRKASQVPANALVDASDWAIIEKRLKRRKSRIYALWFFLALSVCTTSALFVVNQINSKTTPILTQQEKNIDTPTLNHPNNTTTERLTDDFESAESITSTDTSPVEPLELASSDPSILSKNNQRLQPSISNTKLPEAKALVQDLVSSIRQAIEKSHIPLVVALESKAPNFVFDAIYGSAPLWLNQDNVIVQSNSKPSHLAYDKSHWETGISFTPSLSSKISGVNKDLSGFINKSYNTFVANSESATFGNTFGFNAQYHPKGRFFYSSGLYITQRAEQVDYNYTITEGVIKTDNKTLDYYTLDPRAYVDVNYKGSNSYHFIEIPLNIGYKQPISRNFELRTQVGISYLSLLNSSGQKGNFTTLRLDDLSTLNFNTNHIAANLKSGLYYNRPRITLGLEPMIGMNLTNLQNRSTSAILDKPYSYGINLTTNLKLFKQ